ncbi:MAG: OB-fold domain-containing protein, partial [Chloroflexota bacterium]
MIASLEGVVAAISATAVVLEVGGVGYRVFAGPSTL